MGPPEAPEDDPEFDPEEAKKQLEAKDPYEKLLKPITDDDAISTGHKFKQACWSVRCCGDSMEYADANPANGVKSNAVVVVRSLIWPGAFSFFFDGKVQQIYLGHGHKFGQATSNFPVNPPAVMEDPEEYHIEEPDLSEPPVEEQPAGDDDAAAAGSDDD